MVRSGSLAPIFIVGLVFFAGLFVGTNLFGVIDFSSFTFLPQNPLSDQRIGNRVLIVETSSVDGAQCKYEGMMGVIGGIETINGVDYFTVVFDPLGQFEDYRPDRARYSTERGCVLVFES